MCAFFLPKTRHILKFPREQSSGHCRHKKSTSHWGPSSYNLRATNGMDHPNGTEIFEQKKIYGTNVENQSVTGWSSWSYYQMELAAMRRAILNAILLLIVSSSWKRNAQTTVINSLLLHLLVQNFSPIMILPRLSGYVSLLQRPRIRFQEIL